MATDQRGSLTRHLHRVALPHDGAGVGDAELLESFLVRRDEAAFETLVRRHGPMVLGVCRRVLGQEQDAEDAFQATFLVLAHKAGPITPRAAEGNRLYGVAHEPSRKAQAMNRERRAMERQAPPPQPGAAEGVWQRLHELLDEELSLLPDKYRIPLVLCELEGRT